MSGGWRRPLAGAGLGALFLVAAHAAQALTPPASCAAQKQVRDDVTPVPALRRRIDALAERDPYAALGLLCGTLPRVEREYGAESLELARWAQALATPLIAYLDRFGEAVPLLEFAAPILERRLGRNSAELAEIHVAYAWMAFRQSRLADAASAWSDALRIRERNPGPRRIELQKTLVGLAQVRLWQRRFGEARELLGRAYGILRENHESVSEAAAAIENALTNIAVREEDYAEARRHAAAQLAIELQMQGGPAQLVPAYVLLGQVLERLDEYEEAERALREGVRLSESASGPLQRHHRTALLQLGVLLNERGRPREALEFTERALVAAEAELGSDAPALVRPLCALGDVHRALGELPQALAEHDRAAAIATGHAADVERSARVGCHRGYGTLALQLGDRGRAISELEAGIALTDNDPTLSTERAGALVALARLGARDEAAVTRARLREAVALYATRVPAEHPWILRAIDELCRGELESAPEAAPDCDEAVARLDRLPDVSPALRQAVLENQSERAGRRGDPVSMESYAVRSLAAAAALAVPDPLWRAEYQLARALYREDRRPLAIFFGKQALAQIEQLRLNLRGDAARFERGFVEDKLAVYRTVADWLMDAGRIDEALEVLGVLRGEELDDFVLRGAGDATRVNLDEREERWSQRYATAVDRNLGTGADLDQLSRLQEDGRISSGERERLARLSAGERQSEQQRVADLRDFIDSGTREGPGVLAGRRAPSLRFEQQWRRLGPDAALAVYLLNGDRLRMLIATRSGQVEVQLPVDATQLRRDIGALLEDIVERRDVRPRAAALYRLLGRPVDEAARRAGATRLTLWPDGALRYVPFAALYDGSRYLGERYAVQLYADSGPATVRRAAPVAGPTVRGVGVTRAIGGYRALPGMVEELCAVVRGPIAGLDAEPGACAARTAGTGALPGEGYADAAFTEQRLRTLLASRRDFTVLHVGTHFTLRPGNALRSSLLLGDGSLLTVDRLDGFDFGGIELVTLSACQTGLGGARTDDGREVEGLSSLVLRHGAARVVASLWQVEDRSTALLMGEMYRELGTRRVEASRALQLAQRAVRERRVGRDRPFEHPYYWAGFSLTTSAE